MENKKKIERFQILAKFKDFAINVQPVAERIPKNDYLSRSDLFRYITDTIKLINLANYDDNNAKKKDYQIEILANINTIDFILERAYKLGYISEGMVLKRSEELRVINAMVYKWCKNEKVQG